MYPFKMHPHLPHDWIEKWTSEHPRTALLVLLHGLVMIGIVVWLIFADSSTSMPPSNDERVRACMMACPDPARAASRAAWEAWERCSNDCGREL